MRQAVEALHAGQLVQAGVGDGRLGEQKPIEVGQRKQLLDSLVRHLGLREIQYLEVVSRAMSSRPRVGHFRVAKVQRFDIDERAKVDNPASVIGVFDSTREVSAVKPAKYFNWSSVILVVARR